MGYLTQAKYTRDLLARTLMDQCSPSATLIAIKTTSSPNDDEPVNPTEYRGIVGNLQYLTFTRPDITHAINKVDQKFQNPTKADIKAVKRILRYLKGTMAFGIRFLSQSSLTIFSFSDSNW